MTKESFEIVELSSSVGDTDLKSELYKMKTVGVFCKRLELAILENECDFGVHSMKDLQTAVTPGLVVEAIPPLKNREDVVLFNSKHSVTDIADLPDGSRIGSSSLRRIHTLKDLYGHKDFVIENIRGNLNTRKKKLEESFDAIILARAGVERLGWHGQVLSAAEFRYAPAQGSLAV